MKRYPSIEKKINYDIAVVGFDKLDGSNIRAEWQRGKGFTRFGSRRRILDPADETLGRAPDLIRAKYGRGLEEIFQEQGYDKVTAFFEYFGKKSFAGMHEGDDPTLDVVLIDVMPARVGLLAPEDFLTTFNSVPLPPVLFRGRVTDEIAESIRDGSFPGMTFEGVVFKGRGGKKGKLPVMFKIKNRAWLDKLKTHCGDDQALYERLA